MRRKNFKKTISLAAILALAVICLKVLAHCQIPCGIYDDKARFDMITEDIKTIEKSNRQITELTARDSLNMNQIVRWVQNKEEHADHTSQIITYYFMAQRLAPAEKTSYSAYDDYITKLSLFHKMLIYSMKAKQSTDVVNTEKLRSLLNQLKTVYLTNPGRKS